jgi:hypothetical protein
MTTNELTLQQKENLRHVVLSVLALRAGSALTARQILNRAAQEVDFPITEDQVCHAVGVLAGIDPPLAKLENDELGSTIYWQATGAGVLADERQEARR